MARPLTEPHDVVRGFAAKARFLKSAGFQKRVESTIEDALNIVTTGVKEIEDNEACYKLALASSSLRKLLIESGNDDFLQKWFDTAIIVGDRFKSPTMLDDIADALTPEDAKEKAWLLYRIIETLPNPNINWDTHSVLYDIATKLSLIRDEKFVTKCWGQFLEKFAQMKLLFVKNIALHLCACLLKSSTGAEKNILIGKLYSAVMDCLGPDPAGIDTPAVIREMVHTVVKNGGIKDKEEVLTVIDSALPCLFESAWAPALRAIVAEGRAFLGCRKRSASLFRSAIDMIDEIEEGWTRYQVKSKVLLIMAECGFTEQALPELKRLGKVSSLGSDELRLIATKGLLLCGDTDGAMLIADEAGDDDIGLYVAGELFARSVKELIRVDSCRDRYHRIVDRDNANGAVEGLLKNMEKHLRIAAEAQDSSTRDETLQKMAGGIIYLSLDDALLWLRRLPSFPNDHEVWKNLCTLYNYESAIVRKVLKIFPYPVSRANLIKELAKLSGEQVSLKLSLLLSAVSIVDPDCFFNAVCNALENCGDPQVLEMVKLETDTINGYQRIVPDHKPVNDLSKELDKAKEVSVSEDKKIEKEIAKETEEKSDLEIVQKKILECESIKRNDPYDDIIGNSQAIRNVLKLIDQVKDKDITVLIRGETGVGKDLIAHAIHSSGARRKEAFRKVHLGEYQETMIEDTLFGHIKGAYTDAKSERVGEFVVANGGTIFFDEIGTLTLFPKLQVKLLRVLEEDNVTSIGDNTPVQVNVRIIAATNENLEEAVKANTFREDIYYRLNQFVIDVPSLRERKEDIPILAKHFVTSYCKKQNKPKIEFTADAIQKLLVHNWPGNIRELKSRVEEAVLRVDKNIIEAKDLMITSLNTENNSSKSTDSGMDLIIETMKDVKSLRKAEKILGIPRATLSDRLIKWNSDWENLLK